MNAVYLALDQAKNTTLDLIDGDHFRSAPHVMSMEEADALKLALAAQRPLLVRGEPGCGKSQLARAAAHVLGVGQPLVEVIHPRFEPGELLYRFDAMARMLDAQLADKGEWDPTNEKYIEKGVLWRAFERSRQGQQRSVVLIDEIDKADSDLPNSLLDVLANRSFDVPMRRSEQRRVVADAAFNPLILCTTNEERELPAAFVRRCIVLNLNPPAGRVELRRWMLDRANAHAQRAGIMAPEITELAVDQTLEDRDWITRQGFPKVGLAEVVDLLNALTELTQMLPPPRRAAAQRTLLRELSAYGLVKHPVADPGQARSPIAGLAAAASAPLSA